MLRHAVQLICITFGISKSALAISPCISDFHLNTRHFVLNQPGDMSFPNEE